MPSYDLGKAQGSVEVDTSNLQRAQLAFGMFGKSMLGIGTVALAGFGVAAKAAADFEREIDKFGAITGTTGKQLDDVRNKALQLGQDTIFSAGQVAEAIAELAKAGITYDDIMSGAAEAAVHLAAATDIDLAKAADVAANAMNTFNLTGGQMESVVDAIAKAANASTIDVDDLATSLKYAGGPAHALGLSIEETTLALGLMGKAGIRGSTAGTSLRRILLNLSPASKEAAQQMKDLGLITEDGKNQFYDAAGNAKSLKDIMGLLHDATKNLSAEQKVQALNTIFGNRAVSSAILLADQGAKGYDEFAASLAALPSGAEISSKRLDNLSGDIEILKGNIETMLVTAGTPFQEMLRSWVQGITKLIASFTALSPETQKTIMNTVLWTGIIFTAIGAISTILGVLINFVQRIIALGKAIEYLLKLTKIWGILAKGLGLLRTALFGVVGALRTFAVALLTNPIGIIVLAVIALAAAFFLLYKHNKTVHEAVDRFWQSLQVGWDIVLNFARDLIGKFVGAWNSAYAAVSNFITSVAGWFAALPGRVSAGIQAIWDFLTSLPGRAATAFTNFITAAVTWLQQLPMQMAYWLGFALGSLVRFGIDMVLKSIELGTAVVTAIISFFEQLPGRVWGFLVAVFNFMVQFTTDMINKGIEVGSKVLDAVISFFTQLPGRVWGFLVATYNFVVGWVTNMVNKGREVGTQFIQNVITFFQQLPGKVQEFISQVITKIATWATDMATKARETGEKFVNGLRDAIAAAPGVVDKIVDNMIKAITGAVTRAYNAVKDLGGEMWRGFKDGMGIKSPSFIEKATTAMVKNVAEDIKTLEKQVGSMQGLGMGLPDVASQMAVNLTGSGVPAQPADGGLILNMEFTGVAAEDIPAIKSALGSTEVLTTLTQAAKAGRKR